MEGLFPCWWHPGRFAGSSVGIAGTGFGFCCAGRQSSRCWVVLPERRGIDEARRGDAAGGGLEAVCQPEDVLSHRCDSVNLGLAPRRGTIEENGPARLSRGTHA